MTGKIVNKFKKINHHLKSKQIDEKIELLSEIPTNNTGGTYLIEPEYSVQDPDYLDENGDVDYTQDDPELNGRDTTGLFASDGTILTEEPPGDTSYVLGPMSSMYYTYTSPSFTTIGYIRQSDRKMINLGRITGRIENWDGSSNFTSYGQLTLEQAVWFRDIEKVDDYRAFYPGPPSGGSDQYGRYICKITGKPKPRLRTPPLRGVDPRMGGPEDAGFPWGDIFGKGKKKKFDTGEEGEEQGNPFLEALKNLGKSLVNTLERLMLPKEVFDNIVTNYSRQNIEAALSVAGKIIGAESASNTMLAYNKFMANPNGPGSSPSDPFLINSTLSRSDLNKFAPLAKYAKTEIESLRKFASSDEAKEYIPDTKVMRAHGLAGKTKLQAEIEVLEDKISSRSQQIIDTSYGLKNSLHYGLKTKVDIETGEIKLTKGYQFRSGGSVQTFESSPLGQVMTKLGIPADTGSTGFAPVGFAAAALGMPNAKLHGGIYNAPPMYYELNLGVISEGYDSSGTLLTESRKKILREIKQPYKLPEAKKEKIKHRPKVIGSAPRVVGGDMMKKAECPTSFKPIEEKLWGKYEKNKNARASQERKNQVLDMVGTSDHAWEWITETKRNKLNDIMYTNFNGKDKKYKVVRKEEMKGDTLLFIVDENGKKENILQSQLNDRIANEFDKEIFSDYFVEQETAQVDTDPLFSKVKNRLKQVIDYPDKPSREGYPNDPPPQMVNGWHPEYGKDKGYYNKLDPQSAASMPPTGNSEIDAKVQKAKRLKEIIKKKA